MSHQVDLTMEMNGVSESWLDPIDQTIRILPALYIYQHVSRHTGYQSINEGSTVAQSDSNHIHIRQ